MAAKRLSELDAWKRARVVKCNPDPPQIPVRLRALYDGKLLFSPVPYLTKGFPYLRIDPEKLAAKGVDFETAATAQGFLQHGEPVGFEDMPKLDFCVVGCVAVTRRGGRTGKGAGFADLEQGIFRELGLVDSTTPIATTVHSSQVVPEAEVRDGKPRFGAELYRDRARTDRNANDSRPAGRRRLEQSPPRPVRRHPLPEGSAGRNRKTEKRPHDSRRSRRRKPRSRRRSPITSGARMANDVEALDGFFVPTEAAIRFGTGENLYGFAAIKAFRAARSPAGLARKLETHAES